MNGSPAFSPGRVSPSRRGAWLLGTLAAVLLATLAIAMALQSMPTPPVTLTIDGHEVWSGFDLAQMSTLDRLVAAAALLVLLLLALVVLPVALVTGALALAALVLMALSVPLLVVLLVFGALVSPLLLLAWLVWRVAR